MPAVVDRVGVDLPLSFETQLSSMEEQLGWHR